MNGQSQDVSVALTAGETDSAVISAVASAINTAFAGADSDDGVTATALADTSTTSKLVLQSNQTGADVRDDAVRRLRTAVPCSRRSASTRPSAATDTTGGYIYARRPWTPR